MKWSWRIGSIAGIGIFVHATFPLLLFWIALTSWTQSNSVVAALQGVLFILALFACVVLHELGHALAAKRYGIRTRDITLLPIGGVARLERMPEQPLQELWVAVAGPLVNVVIAAILYAGLFLTSSHTSLQELGMMQGSFAARLMTVNVFLVIFNMLPAFPMDGGRVLRALLAMRFDYSRATHIAATIGQGMALLFGFWGFFGNPFLLLIAFFVWIGAAHESSAVQMKTALGGIPVSHAMITDFKSIAPDQTMDDVIQLILSGTQQDFPVVEDGRVVGVLTRSDLLSALAKEGRVARVRDVMSTEFQIVDASEMMERAFMRLQAGQSRTMPVMRDGQLVGLITAENLGELLMIQSALQHTPHR